jgi:hypothetical protein
MYPYLLFFHSLVRWLVLLSVVYALVRSARGWAGKRKFTAADNTMRHASATVAHVQLLLGYMLYFNSPLVAYFRAHYHEAVQHFEFLFFGLIHIVLMTLAIICITIGAAVAKRQDAAVHKFRSITLWYALALLLILIAIPWPFSPLAHRPYIRIF